MFPLLYLFYESFCRGIGTSSAWSLDGMRIGNKDRICTIRGIGLELGGLALVSGVFLLDW
jgi:hypothetical protein